MLLATRRAGTGRAGTGRAGIGTRRHQAGVGTETGSTPRRRRHRDGVGIWDGVGRDGVAATGSMRVSAAAVGPPCRGHQDGTQRAP
jgi:hypothetical protein